MTDRIWIGRVKDNGWWLSLDIIVNMNGRQVNFERHNIDLDTEFDEDEEAIKFVDDFLSKNKHFIDLRSKLLDGFLELKNSGFNGLKISLKKKSKIRSSCAVKNNTDHITTNNGISQSELKQKLAAFKKNGKIIKSFEGNKCSVCLSNYKEILDEDLHIVVPFCGHPLCCKCADGILESKNKKCPQCRGKITAQSFNLMKFNADLTIDTENQRVFL